MNGVQAFLGSASAWGRQAYLVVQPLIRAMWDTVVNVFANKPEPARDVVVSLVALAVLVLFAPRVIKKVVAK